MQSALYKKSYLCCLKPSSVCVPFQMNFNSDPAESVLLALEILAISLDCLFPSPICGYALASFLGCNAMFGQETENTNEKQCPSLRET